MVIIYVLRLEDDKYYIGKANNAYKRIKEHFNGNGSEWTKKYKPLDIQEIIHNEDSAAEDFITKKYMFKYGINNVRGGSYISIELNHNEITVLNKEKFTANDSCFECGSSTHLIKKCPNKYKKINQNISESRYEILDEESSNICGIYFGKQESQEIIISDFDSEYFFKLFQYDEISVDVCLECEEYGHCITDCDYLPSKINLLSNKRLRY